MQEYLFVEKIKEILIKDFGYSAEDIQYCNGIMGVPITFLDKYNPEQFRIITMSTMSGKSANYWSFINGKSKYSRIFILKK